MATKSKPGYRCSECGWMTSKWVGRCGECQAWGSVSETQQRTGILSRVTPIAVTPATAARRITDVDIAESKHFPSGIAEFDRVLGGGIVPGAAILLSGEPGVGKSTLLLEVAAKVAKRGSTVLYVSAEESASQVRMRAGRTDALTDNLYLASETDLSAVLGQVDAVSPDLLIVDSVQTVSSGDIDSIAGGPSQVREVSSALTRLAKERGLPLILVGHVTKDGAIAGPRVLEHLVDVVCHFEGDRQSALRFVRALKNRFGPTDEVGCFEMTESGIAEVPDPSGLFLSRSTAPVSGTCVTMAMEGRRPLPVEVQALITSSSTPQPRRVTNGVDSSRVAMLLAILERRSHLKLSDKDVYVSTVGGIKLQDPGADLAIALAIASAVIDKALPHTLAAHAEISLAGELRPVNSGKQRGNEASRLGFSRVLDDRLETLSEALRVAGLG